MISDELFDKIIQLEKQSEELIQNAKEQAQAFEASTRQAIEKLKQQTEEEIHQVKQQKHQELLFEQKTLESRYQKMYEDISQKILKKRDDHIQDILNQFKKEMTQH